MTKLFAWVVFVLTTPIWVPLTLVFTILEVSYRLGVGSVWLLKASFVTVYWSIDTVRGATELSLGEYIKKEIV